MPQDSPPEGVQPHDADDADAPSPLDELELAYQRALANVEALEATLPGEVVDGKAQAESDAALETLPFRLRLVTDQDFGDHTSASEGAEPPQPIARLTPAQVIEAALFVGGDPLTARKLCSLLRDDSDHELIDRTIESLNARYAAQGRPYLIRLGEGGYRMELRAEFEGVRNRVFGYGPKEVRLSQDAVETLAVVAYRQPAGRQHVEQVLERPAGATLNQLLRRELIALERGEDGEVAYRTTSRFLELFGLGGIHELPQPDELSFK